MSPPEPLGLDANAELPTERSRAVPISTLRTRRITGHLLCEYALVPADPPFPPSFPRGPRVHLTQGTDPWHYGPRGPGDCLRDSSPKPTANEFGLVALGRELCQPDLE